MSVMCFWCCIIWGITPPLTPLLGEAPMQSQHRILEHGHGLWSPLYHLLTIWEEN